MEKKLPVILLCDSDITLSTILNDYLTSQDFQVDVVRSTKEAREALQNKHYNLLLTEFRTSSIKALDLLQVTTAARQPIPFIILTETADKDCQLKAFAAGCDDYILKPFSMELLVCRINAVLRRFNAGVDNETSEFDLGGKHFDAVHQIFDGKHMSSRESDLLLLLCRSMNQLVDRHYILSTLWKNDDYFASRSLSVYINHLRKYLDGTGYRIIGVHGKGYKIVDAI